jgi:serine/threonine protein kinase
MPIPHGNLTPSNTLMDENNNIFLTDISQTVKSIEYSAPEYKMGDKTTILGDLYCLGLLIYEIFTG